MYLYRLHVTVTTTVIYDRYALNLLTLPNVNTYGHLVGKLIYLKIAHLNISYTASLLSINWHTALRFLAYLKQFSRQLAPGQLHIKAYSNSGDQKSTYSFGTFVRGNLVTWRGQKQ